MKRYTKIRPLTAIAEFNSLFKGTNKKYSMESTPQGDIIKVETDDIDIINFVKSKGHTILRTI